MLTIFDALQPCAMIRDGKLLTDWHLRAALEAGPQPHDIPLPLVPGIIPHSLVILERENLRHALFVLGLHLPNQIVDRRQCTPVLRSAARRLKTIKDRTTGERGAITVGDVWQMDVRDFVWRIHKNFSRPAKPIFTRPWSISPSPEGYWIAPLLLRRPTAIHSCLKCLKRPPDGRYLSFSHDPLTFRTGRVIGYSNNGNERLERAFRPATKTICPAWLTSKYHPAAQKYLADAEANRAMIAGGEAGGRLRRTIPIPPNDHELFKTRSAPDPEQAKVELYARAKRLIVDWPEPRFKAYTEAFDEVADRVIDDLLREKGERRNLGLREALRDESARLAGAEKPVAPEHLYKHLYDRLHRQSFSAGVSDLLDVMLDGALVTEQTEFREQLDDDERRGAATIEKPLDAYNVEPAEQDDDVSIAIEDLSARMLECLDVESKIVKGAKLLTIAMALAEGKSQADVAKGYGCDQSQISRAKLEIRSALRECGFGAPEPRQVLARKGD